ncbi:MAG: cell division protein FtsB [Candidatus Krumholzibacteriia bacterium]|jgi:cell division protein FtsB
MKQPDQRSTTDSQPTAKDGFVRGKPASTFFARRSLYVLVGLGMLGFVAAGQIGTNGIFAFFELQKREAELRQEVAELDTANYNLDKQLESLANDPEALEKLAREKHNMRREGEEVLHVLPSQSKD